MRSLLSLPVLLLLLACGGGGGPGGGGGGGGGVPVTVTLTSLGTEDGVVTNGGSSTIGGMTAGDDDTQVSYRGILRFDVSAIPLTATVVSATLRTNQYEVLGTPYATLGPLVVDHVVLGNDPLGPMHFALAAQARVPGSLSTTPVLGSKSIDVTASVQDDLTNGRSRSDYRVQFDGLNDGDVVADICNLTTGDYDGLTGEFATLEVTYTP